MHIRSQGVPLHTFNLHTVILDAHTDNALPYGLYTWPTPGVWGVVRRPLLLGGGFADTRHNPPSGVPNLLGHVTPVNDEAYRIYKNTAPGGLKCT